MTITELVQKLVYHAIRGIGNGIVIELKINSISMFSQLIKTPEAHAIAKRLLSDWFTKDRCDDPLLLTLFRNKDEANQCIYALSQTKLNDTLVLYNNTTMGIGTKKKLTVVEFVDIIGGLLSSIAKMSVDQLTYSDIITQAVVIRQKGSVHCQ